MQAQAAADAARSLGKCIRFEQTFTTWGTTVQGESGRVRVCLNKRRQLFRLLTGVVLQIDVGRNIMEMSLGGLVFLLFFKTPNLL